MTKKYLEAEIMSTEPTDSPIEFACVRFETVWKADTRPQLENFLAGWQEPKSRIF